MNYQCHLMTFEGVSREFILGVLDTVAEVKNWRAAAGAILIVTESTVTSAMLSEAIAQHLGMTRFVVVPIWGTMAQGRADLETWQFINTPQPLNWANALGGGLLPKS